MTARAFGGLALLVAAMALAFLVLLTLGGCELSVEYHLTTYRTEAPIESGDVAGYLPRDGDPPSTVWTGDGFEPSWPLGAVCDDLEPATVVGFEPFRCRHRWVMLLRDATITCEAVNEGAFTTAGLIAFSWPTCTCAGSCGGIFVFVLAPTWYVGRRA